ncbi:hypothetical protein JIQ42_00629 [Leishmania sp. Namibia]|uniref:hypothetical protein n=1 Tax=Leishmania sp. Namibia TaxID=2802991 RepID=UPI001B7B66B8|nr:hypothetical protein JIQ42_00629 [Leishmania sp. Namibia]
MPSNTSAASLPRHASAAAFEYVRALTGSAPISGSLSISNEGETPVETAAASRAPHCDNWNAHLAQLLHGMCLVSLIEKAQLGAMHYSNGSSSCVAEMRISSDMASLPPASGGLSASHEQPMHSVAVDDRWLDAVTRYCHFTCSIDDVARVAMAFPELVRVRWTLQTSRGSAPPPVRVRADGHSDATEPLSLSASDQQVTSARSRAASSVGKLLGRLYLMASHVISVQEAELHLQQALQRKGTLAAQHAWRELVNHHTAYSAYADWTKSVMAPSPDVKAGGAAPPMWQAPNATAGTLDDFSDTSTGGKATACDKSDDQLLQQVSAELRVSLSAPMLRALLTQMRRDVAQTEKHERQRTAERQLSERVMSAYEQVRALLGGKHASSRSAWSLLVAMRAESRFHETLDAVALLSRLLCISASGLTATMLREAEVQVERRPPTRKGTAATANGKKARGKRKREAEEADATSLFHATKAVLESVTDLRGLSEEQLQLVRVQLDRSKGSVKGVLEAMSQVHVG